MPSLVNPLYTVDLEAIENIASWNTDLDPHTIAFRIATWYGGVEGGRGKIEQVIEILQDKITFLEACKAAL